MQRRTAITRYCRGIRHRRCHYNTISILGAVVLRMQTRPILVLVLVLARALAMQRIPSCKIRTGKVAVRQHHQQTALRNKEGLGGIEEEEKEPRFEAGVLRGIGNGESLSASEEKLSADTNNSHKTIAVLKEKDRVEEELEDGIISTKEECFVRITALLANSYKKYFVVNHAENFHYTQVQLKSQPEDLMYKDQNSLYLSTRLQRKEQMKRIFSMPQSFYRVFVPNYVKFWQDDGSFLKDYQKYLLAAGTPRLEANKLISITVAALCMRPEMFDHNVYLSTELKRVIELSDYSLAKNIVVNIIAVGQLDIYAFTHFLRSQSKIASSGTAGSTKQIVKSIEEHAKHNSETLENKRERLRLLSIASFVNVFDQYCDSVTAEKYQNCQDVGNVFDTKLDNFLFRLLVHVTVMEGNLLLASSLCIEHRALAFNKNKADPQIMSKQKAFYAVDKNTINKLLDSLLVFNPLYDKFYIDAIIKLCVTYSITLTPAQALKFFQKALNVEDLSNKEVESFRFPIISNRVYHFIISNLKLSLTDDLVKYFSHKRSTRQKLFELKEKQEEGELSLKEVRALMTSSQMESRSVLSTMNEYKALDLASFFRHTSDLIQFNVEMNNVGAVYLIWASLIYYQVDLNYVSVNAIIGLMKIFRSSRKFRQVAIDLIHLLPAERLANVEIASMILNIAADHKDGQLARSVLKNVGTFKPRLILRSLLRFYLSVEDEYSTETILGMLFQSRKGLQPSEFNEVIISILKKGMFNKAYELISQNQVAISSSAYVSFIDRLVNRYKVFTSENLTIIEEFVLKLYYCYENKLISTKTKKQLCYLSMIYLKYIIRHYGIYVARKIYLNSSLQNDSDINFKNVPAIFKTANYNGSLDALSVSENYISNLDTTRETDSFAEHFMSMPFNEPLENIKKIRLFIPNRIKIIALKHIVDEAARINNIAMFKWGIVEILKLGISGVDIMVDYSRKHFRGLTKLGFEIPTYNILSKKERLSDPQYVESIAFRNTRSILEAAPESLKKNRFNLDPKDLAKFNTLEKQEQYMRLNEDKNLILRKFWEVESRKLLKRTIENYEKH